MATAQTRFASIPFYYNPDLRGDPDSVTQRARCLPLEFDFTTAATQAFSQNLSDIGLECVQSVYIDASQCQSPTTLVFAGTRQRLVIPPYWQGWKRLMVLNQNLDFVVANFGGARAASLFLHFVNVEITEDLWSANDGNGLLGTPFANSATGANTSLTVSVVNLPGRRAFLTKVIFNGGGSTAGLDVLAAISNLDNAGVAHTLNTAFIFPVGALVPAAPVILDFNPPQPILLGAQCNVNLPAGGAGNVRASVSVMGFYY